MQRFLALFFIASTAIPLFAAEEFLIVPFQNQSGASGVDWLGESTSETLREVLVSNGVTVVERDQREETAQRLFGGSNAILTRAALLKLGEQVECTHIIYGEVNAHPDEHAASTPAGLVRITARIIDLDRFAAVPALEEEGPAAELSEIQARLAWNLLRSLGGSRSPSPDVEERPPVKNEAAEHYIHGLQSTNSAQKHRHFTQAVLLDAKFSEPCFQLGVMQWEERNYRVAARWLEKVKPHDAHYFEANFLLGLCRYHLGDTAGGVQSFQLLARSRPSSEVWNNLGISRFRLNDREGWDSLTKALQADSDDPDYQFNAGYQLWKQGDFEGAMERFRAVLKIDPADVDAQLLLDRCINRSGPRRGDLSGHGLERLKENYQSAGISQWNLAKAASE